MDAWVEPSAVGHKVDLHVPKNKLTSCKKMLKKNGIEFSSMVDDLEDLLNEEERSNQKNAFASYYNYEKYNTWSEVTKKYIVHKKQCDKNFCECGYILSSFPKCIYKNISPVF